MELLSVVLQVIVSLIVRLLELYEFVSLLGDLVVVTESHVKLLVLNTLGLLWEDGVHVLLELLFVLCLEHLDVCQCCQALLLTVYQKISGLLESQSMVTLRVVDLIKQVLVDQLMSSEKLRLLRILKNTNPNQEVLHPVRSLDLIKVELSLESMVNLIVSSEQVVDDLDDWIVVSEALRIGIAAQFIGNVNFLSLFKFENEHCLLQLDLAEYSLQIKQIGEAAYSEHELDLRQLGCHLHPFELHL